MGRLHNRPRFGLIPVGGFSNLLRTQCHKSSQRTLHAGGEKDEELGHVLGSERCANGACFERA